MGRTIPSYRIATEMERDMWKHLGKDWTRRTERSLTKCFLIPDCLTLRVVILTDQY